MDEMLHEKEEVVDKSKTHFESPMNMDFEENLVLNVTNELIEENNLTCQICLKQLNNKSLLKGHINEHPVCASCGQRFKTVGLMRRHTRLQHGITKSDVNACMMDKMKS